MVPDCHPQKKMKIGKMLGLNLALFQFIIFWSQASPCAELAGGKVIVVGGDHYYPPHEFINEAGQPDGYNVELTRAIPNPATHYFKLGPKALFSNSSSCVSFISFFSSTRFFRFLPLASPSLTSAATRSYPKAGLRIVARPALPSK